MKLRYLLIALAATLFAACSEDDLDSKSIFQENSSTVKNEFDEWIQKNYVEQYNINLKYRFEYKESDTKYNVVPAAYDKSVALAIMTKYLWLESYEELLGKDFIRTYCPKILFFVGSPEYNSQGSIILGTAEGGMKITLFNVNNIDYKNPDIEFLNYWYFKTMHHEFAHILHQTKPYPTDFNEITPSDYQSASWVNVGDEEALHMGFITPYASNETQEDFVEMISNYVTHDQDWWDEQLWEASFQEGTTCLTCGGDTKYTVECEACGGTGVVDTDGDGKADAYCSECEGYGELGCPDCEGRGLDQTMYGTNCLNAKLEIVRDWLKTSWNINLDQLREIVQTRSANVEAGEIDLQSLK